MAFSLDNPGFSLGSGEDPLKASATELSLQHSSATPPASGDSACCNCQKCHGRMSSLSLNRHSFCYKCLGAHRNLENRCDECMSWFMEEMESYVKLRKSLASKRRGKKSSSSKTPSFPRPIAPVSVTSVDLDDRISIQFSVLTCEFDKKLVTYRWFIRQV